MRLGFRAVDTFPRLAWCARLVKGHDTAEVLHGPWVETGDDFFWEGAWSGDFPSRDFDVHQCVGSGGKLLGNRLVLASPNHTLDRIFLLRSARTLWISNSFDCVLACARDGVNPRALLYAFRLSSVVEGLRSYSRTLPTRDGNRVRLYYHCNLMIDSRLDVVEEPKRPVREFSSFEDYRTFLLEQIAAINANASDPRRRIIYRPIATVSAGYDSPAAAVLARSVGCTEALTFADSRANRANDTTDSGAAIAAKLGMTTRVFSRLDYLRAHGCPEAEFLGWGAPEAVWAPHLEARLVFTGFHGDKVWDRNCKTVGSHIVRGDPSGYNLTSFRLRVGWIHVPVPFLGCTSHPSIHRISTSTEMEPWSLKNNYDRPIPRRLLEEAGVGRHEFGTRKRAAMINLLTEGLRERFTEESYDDYVSYYDRHWNAWMSIKRAVFLLLRAGYRKHHHYNARTAALLKKWVGLDVTLPILIPRSMRIGEFGDLGRLALLVNWSTEKMLARYQVEPRHD